MKLPTNYSLTNHVYILLNMCKKMIDARLLLLHSILETIVLCASKMNSSLFKNVLYKIYSQIIYI